MAHAVLGGGTTPHMPSSSSRNSGGKNRQWEVNQPQNERTHNKKRETHHIFIAVAFFGRVCLVAASWEELVE